MTAIKISLLVLLLPAAAGALEVTSTQTSENGINVVLGGLMTVKSVAMKKGSIVLPSERSKGRKYHNIRILSSGFFKKVSAAFVGIVSSSPARGPSVKVEIKRLKSGFRTHNAEVSFDGDLLAVFGILNKKSGPEISYPGNFEIMDSNFKKMVEREIFKKFGESL